MRKFITILIALMILLYPVMVNGAESEYTIEDNRYTYGNNKIGWELDIKHNPSGQQETGVVEISILSSLAEDDVNYDEYANEYGYTFKLDPITIGQIGDMNTDVISAQGYMTVQLDMITSTWDELVSDVQSNPDGYTYGGMGRDTNYLGIQTISGHDAIILESVTPPNGNEETYSVDESTIYDLNYSGGKRKVALIRLHEYEHLTPSIYDQERKCFYVFAEINCFASYDYEGTGDQRSAGKSSVTSYTNQFFNQLNSALSAISINIESVPFEDGMKDIVVQPAEGFIKVAISSDKIVDNQLIVEGIIESSSKIVSGGLIRASGASPIQGSTNIGVQATKEDGTVSVEFSSSCEFSDGSGSAKDIVFYLNFENTEGKSSEKRLIYGESGTLKESKENNLDTGKSPDDITKENQQSGMSEEQKEEFENLLNLIPGAKGTGKVPGPDSLAVLGLGLAAGPGLAALAQALSNLNGGGSGPDGGPGSGPDDSSKDGQGNEPDNDDDYNHQDSKDNSEEPDYSSEEHWGASKTIIGKTDGREYNLRYNKTLKKWFYEESGTEYSSEDFERFQNDLARDRADARKTTERFEKRDTEFDKAMDSLVEEQKDNAFMLKKLARIKQSIFFGSGKGLYRGDGVPGDVITKIEEMESKMEGGIGLDKNEYEKVKELFNHHVSGKTTTEDNLEKMSLAKDLYNTAKLSGEEIARGESYKAMALKAVVGIATGGSSEIGFESARALVNMKDYVDRGGNSSWEGFKEAAENVIVDEIMGRIVEKGVTKVAKGGKGAIKYIKENADEIADDINNAKKAVTDKLRKVSELLAKNKKVATDQLKEQAESAEKKAMELIRKSRKNIEQSADLVNRDSAFFAGRTEGFKKVQKLENARKQLELNPDSTQAKKAFKKSVEEIQMDKHAMHQLNDIEGDAAEKLRKGFNKQMEETYETSIENSRKRLAKEYGVDVDDIEIVKASNDMKTTGNSTRNFAKKPKGGTTTTIFDEKIGAPKADIEVSGKKVSYDKDVTFRVKQKDVLDARTGKVTKGNSFVDVPEADAKRIYNEEFYKAAKDGEVPITKVDGRGMNKLDTDAIDDYATKMDQNAGDRLSTESYGTGNDDLVAAVKAKNQKFSDVEAVGKTMEYKANHWDNMGEDCLKNAKIAEANGDFAKANQLRMTAEACKEEGMRQTTKQFNNQIVDRVAIVNGAAGKDLIKIPDNLAAGIKIMEKVGAPGGISAAEAEIVLKELNLTPQKVAQQSSSILESIQKLGFL